MCVARLCRKGGCVGEWVVGMRVLNRGMGIWETAGTGFCYYFGTFRLLG